MSIGNRGWLRRATHDVVTPGLVPAMTMWRRLPYSEQHKPAAPPSPCIDAGPLFSVLGAGFGTERRPAMIQRRVSAGSMTLPISNTEAIETALPLA